MRIAIDIRAARGNRSGVGFFVYSLVRSLARIDRKNEYLLMSNRDVDLPFALPPNFAKHITDMPVSNLWLQTVCPALLARHRVDVFHGTNFVVPLAATVPRVVTVYDLTPHLFPELHSRANTIVQKLVPQSVKRSRLVIAVSEHTKRDLKRLWNVPGGKVRVVYGAAGDEFSPIDDRAELERFRVEHDLPEKFILAVGTLEPRKNLTTVFESFHRLRQDGHTDVKLVLVGDRGWRYDPIFERLDALDLREHVHLAGYHDWDTLRYIYNLASVLVYPSLYEGFGLPPLEAMACGTPAVVADNSSLPEVVPDPALRVDAHDPAALARAVARLLSDDGAYRRAVEEGRKTAASFNWDRAAALTLEAYREAAGG